MKSFLIGALLATCIAAISGLTLSAFSVSSADAFSTSGVRLDEASKPSSGY